jgi:alanine dehydrogenase
MARLKSVGFPRMNKESGEKRVFLPAFIQYLTRYGEVYLEEGYGSRSGFTFDDYRQGNPRVWKCSRQEAFQKDYVIVLRSPNEDEFQLMRRGAVLLSMLHYPTRPHRVQILQELGINAISMDSVVDDNNMRMVENMRSVAWNGLEAAFDYLEKDCPGLVREGKPYNVMILGTGMVGKHAIDAATKLGNIERNNRHISLHGPGALAMCAGRNITSCAEQMERLFPQMDILVDATNRRDPSLPVVQNHWLDWLPPHAVVADLAVDPYLLDHQPVIVRGVEGIPQGNLNHYTFTPDDAEWDKTVPASVGSKHRRAVVSCYSWPGIHPEACMEHYARQLEPLMEILLTRPFEALTLEGSYFERALARAKVPEI